MNVLFIGSNLSVQGEVFSYELSKQCDKKGLSYSKYPISSQELEDIQERLLARTEDIYVYDYTSFEEVEQKAFVSMLLEVSEAKNNYTIIYAPMPEGAKFINTLKAAGFTKIISEIEDRTLIKNQIEEFITAPKSVTSVSVASEILDNREMIGEDYKKIVEPVTDLSNAKITVRIAVCGVIERVGTTAVAIQLCKTLNLSKSNSAGYIEVKGNYIDNLSSYYYCNEIDGGVKYGGVSLYKDISKVKTEGFDYLVYDYGKIDKTNEMAILDKDIVIVVGKTGPSEIHAFTPAIEMTINSPVVNYVFYDAPKNKDDRSELLSMMTSAQNRTFFVEHISDPFSLDHSNKNALIRIVQGTSIDDKEYKKKRLIDRLFA